MDDKEPAYDEHIAPLMTQIIDLCREHGIPMFASFRLRDENEETGEPALVCTTNLPVEGVDHSEFARAYNCVVHGYDAVRPAFNAFWIATAN